MENEIEVIDSVICPAVGHQIVEICVPVHVRPFARIGRIITRCCGRPIVVPGTDFCEDMPPTRECGFTINQKICVEVPVEFGAETNTGQVHSNCDRVSAENICRDCNNDDDNDDDDDDDDEQ